MKIERLNAIEHITTIYLILVNENSMIETCPTFNIAPF